MEIRIVVTDERHFFCYDCEDTFVGYPEDIAHWIECMDEIGGHECGAVPMQEIRYCTTHFYLHWAEKWTHFGEEPIYTTVSVTENVDVHEYIEAIPEEAFT